MQCNIPITGQLSNKRFCFVVVVFLMRFISSRHPRCCYRALFNSYPLFPSSFPHAPRSEQLSKCCINITFLLSCLFIPEFFSSLTMSTVIHHIGHTKRTRRASDRATERLNKHQKRGLHFQGQAYSASFKKKRTEKLLQCDLGKIHKNAKHLA